MKIKTTLLLALSLLLLFAGCDSVETTDLVETPNSELHIGTRSGEGASDATISYPVYVYVFKGETCLTVQTIDNENTELNIPLFEGDYTVIGVGGASPENYDTPTKENATPSMPLKLKDGKQHGDLMTAKSTVSLVDGGDLTLNLALDRKVLGLNSVTIDKIPAAASSVYLTISPLYAGLSGADYNTKETATARVDLTHEDGSRTWTLANPLYLLPPSSTSTTITVNMVIGDETKSFAYSTSNIKGANHHLNLVGTYTEAVGVTMTGSIIGATWAGEQTISFEFNNSGSTSVDTPSDDGDSTDETPSDENNGNTTDDSSSNSASGKTRAYYEGLGCTVVNSTDKGDGTTELLLLSPKTKTFTVISGELVARDPWDAGLASCSLDGVSGWRVMTLDEAKIIQPQHLTILDGKYVYVLNGESVGYCRFWSSGDTQLAFMSGYKEEAVLCPVTTVTIPTANNTQP